MDFTPLDSESFTNELTKEATAEASRDLEALRRHLLVAAEHTKDLHIAEALEYTENYLRRIGIEIPSKLSVLIQRAWGEGVVGEPLHNQPIDLAASSGAWGDLFLDKSLNLVAGGPKAGKSAIVCHMFACALRGDAQCLDKPIRKRWNKLIISGNDMSAAHWGKILIREGLATHIPDPNDPDAPGKFRPCPEVFLWDQSTPARMNAAGIAAMRAKCLEHPDSLLLIDSLRSNVDASIDENSAEIRGPIEELKAGLADCNVTIALVHHANKSVSGSTAITASAGNNAIPASCDGTLLLKHLTPEPVSGFRSDNRLMLSASGRNRSDRALVEITSDGIGRWIAHSDMESALQEEAVHDMEERLTSRQLQVYEYAEELAEMSRFTTAKEVGSQFNLTQIKARKSLEQLTRKGVLVRCGTEPTGSVGREPVLYAPTLSALARAKRDENGVSNVSMVPIGELKPLIPFEPPSGDLPAREAGSKSPLPPPNTPVERCLDGIWSNGFKLHPDTLSPHSVVIWHEIAGRTLITRNLRWDFDVRLCQPAPQPEPFDESTLEF